MTENLYSDMNNIIFCGPPGTGKTYEAKKRALEVVWNYLHVHQLSIEERIYYNPQNFCEKSYVHVTSDYLSDKGNPMIRLISIHDGMMPSDLMEGFSVSTKNGNPIYEEVDKQVIELIQDVEDTQKPGVLIFDDIQRANFAGVIGELIYAFAHRNKAITLSSGRIISVPNNLYVFMTMNNLMPQYELDNGILNSFNIQYTKNDSVQLNKSITEWGFKEFYFNCVLDYMKKIASAKDDICDYIGCKTEDCSFFTEAMKGVLNINYQVCLIKEHYNKLYDAITDYDPAANNISSFVLTEKLNKKTENIIKELLTNVYNVNKLYNNTKNDIAKLQNKANEEWTRFNNFISTNLSTEYEEQVDLYKIGYSYFIPSSTANLQYSVELLEYKIRGQVLPLIKQYIAEGIIKDGNVPGYETTFTRYSFTCEEDRISFPEIAKTQRHIDLFKSNMGNWSGLNYPENTTIPYNANYAIVFDIVKQFIDAYIISDWQIIDILTNDTNIVYRLSNVGEYNYTGCLLAIDSIAMTISAADNSKRKNEYYKDGSRKSSGNEKLSAYSKKLHKLVYKNRSYYFTHKFECNKSENRFSVEQCRQKEAQRKRSFNADIYKVVKTLVYDLIRKYKENIEGMINESDVLPQEIEELNKELVLISDSLQRIDAIEWHGTTPDEKRLNLYNDIINMEFMKRMKNDELKGVYMVLDERYQSVMDATGIHQMILQGPPGTSKTYGAKAFLAQETHAVDNDGNWDEKELEKTRLVSKTAENGNDIYELPTNTDSNVYWDIIQFHPSYTYEDFVRGITVHTPKQNECSSLKGAIKAAEKTIYDIELERGSYLSYKTVNKTLGKMAAIATAHKESGKRFYLIIDEINRANLASVFGELIYALEYRDGKGVSTPYSIDGNSAISIPDNMYIIGTMNTADKSIASIDYAIRRRFLFFPVLPDINVVYESVKKDVNAVELKLFYITKVFFELYYNSNDYNLADIEIGHTFFLRKRDIKSDIVPSGYSLEEYQMKMRYLYQVIPVLKEYINDGIILEEINSLNSDKDFSDMEESINLLKTMLKNNNTEKISEMYDELVNSMGESLAKMLEKEISDS